MDGLTIIVILGAIGWLAYGAVYCVGLAMMHAEKARKPRPRRYR